MEQLLLWLLEEGFLIYELEMGAYSVWDVGIGLRRVFCETNIK